MAKPEQKERNCERELDLRQATLYRVFRSRVVNRRRSVMRRLLPPSVFHHRIHPEEDERERDNQTREAELIESR